MSNLRYQFTRVHLLWAVWRATAGTGKFSIGEDGSYVLTFARNKSIGPKKANCTKTEVLLHFTRSKRS